MKQEAERLAALGLAPAEIARRLGVHFTTVYRWMKEGKLTIGRVSGAGDAGVLPGSGEAWAATVRATFALDPTDEALVQLATAALETARTAAEASTRLTATARFQSLVKQLHLGARVTVGTPAAPDATTRPARRHGGGDPRLLLVG